MGVRLILLAAIVASIALFGPSGLSVVLAGPPNVGANDHDDDRFDWRNRYVEYSDGNRIYLHWYPGSIDADQLDLEKWLADRYLDDVVEARQSMENLTGTDINHDMHIYVYRDWETMRQFYPSTTPYPSGLPLPIDTGDELPAFAIDGDTILTHSDGGNRVSSKYLQRELAHLVLKEALWNPSKGEYAKAPLWLDEGLAQLVAYDAHHGRYSLSQLRRWFLTGNRLAPVCGMTEYPIDEREHRHFHTKSLALATILANEDDYRTFTEFVGKLKRGWALESALNSTFQLSRYDLERRWLKFADLDEFVPPAYCSVPADAEPAPPAKHEDTRFTWQTRTRGLVTVHWYDDTTVADPFRSYDVDYMLAEANDALRQMEALVGVTVTDPVHLWVYSKWEDLAPHYVSDGGPPPAAFYSIRKGEAFLDASRGWLNDGARHEVAHLVDWNARLSYIDMWEGDREAIDAPKWLDEGIATNAERLRSYSPSDYVEWLEAGGRNTPLCGMAEYPLEGTAKDNFYGKSYLVMKHLLETGGAAGLTKLVQRLGVGDDIDTALSAAYGLTQHDLEEYWLELTGIGGVAQRCAV